MESKGAALKAWNQLNDQINRAAFWCAVVGLATTIISFFLPLDVPEGYSATVEERVAWLVAHSGTFKLAWINQIASMIALSGVLAGIAWQVARTHPLQALLGGFLVALATMAFFIPKFIAVWTIPMLAESIATGAVTENMALGLLPILNVTVPFSLYTSFDYLGFWLYSLAALVVTKPLLLQSASIAKTIGVAMGVFGLAYNAVVVAILMGFVGRAEVGSSILSAAFILLIPIIASLFLFRTSATQAVAGPS